MFKNKTTLLGYGGQFKSDEFLRFAPLKSEDNQKTKRESQKLQNTSVAFSYTLSRHHSIVIELISQSDAL